MSRVKNLYFFGTYFKEQMFHVNNVKISILKKYLKTNCLELLSKNDIKLLLVALNDNKKNR